MFSEPPEQIAGRKKRFAENTVAKFCKLAMSENFSTNEKLKHVKMFLTWLNAFSNRFVHQKNKLQSTQEKIQKQALEQDSKDAFSVSTAMNTMIFYLSKPSTDEHRQYFIESIRSAIEILKERKSILLEQQLSETKSEALVGESPSPSSL